MKSMDRRLHLLCLLLALALTLCGCGGGTREEAQADREAAQDAPLDTSRFLVAVEDEPDTVDFQCTTIYYTVATNVFNRLVEMESDENGDITVRPSLAESWQVSDDGRSYTFRLRQGVTFSNGSPLTSEDVRYSLERLLTHPDSCNRDIAGMILGAAALESGASDQLEGFETVDDLTFTITLEQPFEAFLACLSMPGASIMDRESVEAAGDRFGLDPTCTVGTGSFVLHSLVPGEGMVLVANPDCWEGAPKCEGLDLRFMTEPEEIRMMFENGTLDILDLDDLGNSAEFFLHGDIYQDRLRQVQPIGITYIALNESVQPLDDVRVRRALQLSLNRPMLLDAVYRGHGSIENGIFSRGLYGYNPELPEIPFDPEEARKLLAEAGYADGFDLTISVKASSAQWEMTLMRLAASMWEEVGVGAAIDVVDEDTFMRRRKKGELTCYAATWTADYDDPDNYIYTFFGSRENTDFRSLCYPDEDIMERVRDARMISDPDARLAEYRALEQIIVQQDAAWIPLFSRLRNYVISVRCEGIYPAWNGSVKNNYRKIALKQ